VLLWKDIERAPRTPPSITNSEGNGRWKERWGSPQEAAFGEKGEGESDEK